MSTTAPINSKEQEKILKMHQAYEEYIFKVLDVLHKKLEVVTDFRKEVGRKKIDKLTKDLERSKKDVSN